MSKKLSIALTVGLGLLTGAVSTAYADGYEDYAPPPVRERRIEHDDSYNYPPRPAQAYYEDYSYPQQSQELNGALDLEGFVGVSVIRRTPARAAADTSF